MAFLREYGKDHYQRIRVKPPKKEAKNYTDAIDPYHSQAKPPKTHSGKVVDSFDGALELTLWSDPKVDADAYEYARAQNYSHPHGSTMPKLGNDILNVWRWQVRDLTAPVKLSELDPAILAHMSGYDLTIYPRAVERGRAYHVHCTDDKGNQLYFRLNGSDNWPCFAIRFSADFMEDLIGKDYRKELARYLSALFEISEKTALEVFEPSRVDFCLTYDTELTTEKIIDKVKKGLFRCRLRRTTIVNDPTAGDSFTIGKGNGVYQIQCYNKGAELVGKEEYGRCEKWCERLEIEEVGTMALDPCNGQGFGRVPFFYRIELRCNRELLRNTGFLTLQDLELGKFKALLADLFQLLSRKCTNNNYEDLDPEYAALFGNSELASSELAEHKRRALAVRQFKKLKGLPASNKALRGACTMFAKKIGTNKNPFIVLRLWCQEISAKLPKYLPEELGAPVSIVLKVIADKVEQYSNKPQELLKFFSMTI